MGHGRSRFIISKVSRRTGRTDWPQNLVRFPLHRMTATFIIPINGSILASYAPYAVRNTCSFKRKFGLYKRPIFDQNWCVSKKSSVQLSAACQWRTVRPSQGCAMTDGCGEFGFTFLQFFVVSATKSIVTSWTRVFVVESEDLLGGLFSEANRYVGMPLYLGRWRRWIFAVAKEQVAQVNVERMRVTLCNSTVSVWIRKTN